MTVAEQALSDLRHYARAMVNYTAVMPREDRLVVAAWTYQGLLDGGRRVLEANGVADARRLAKEIADRLTLEVLALFDEEAYFGPVVGAASDGGQTEEGRAWVESFVRLADDSPRNA